MRNNPIIYLLAGLLLSLLIPGCIEEFTPKTGTEISDILVVEGRISGGDNTIIKLSRSVGLSEEITANPVSNATIYAESSDGWKSELGYEIKEGEYLIHMGDLNTALSYNLVISTGGKEYRSTPSQPLITPEIDSVSWKKKDYGEPVTIHVTSHDNSRSIGYYRWSYKEDWEIVADYFANADYDLYTNVYTPYSLDSFNTYYCWNTDSSRVLLLENTEKLSGNLIYEKKLLSIPPIDDKISYLYSILVKQWSLSKSAYYYYANLQNNIDEAGSLFAPQPSELRGNIECITDPSEPVIGYIDVTTVTEKRIYITEKEVRDPGRRYRPCITATAKSPSAAIDSMRILGLVLLFSPIDLSKPNSDRREIALTEKRCVDCRLKGNKIKPYFWPNDHK